MRLDEINNEGWYLQIVIVDILSFTVEEQTIDECFACFYYVLKYMIVLRNDRVFPSVLGIQSNKYSFS